MAMETSQSPTELLDDIKAEADAIRDFVNYINNEPVSEWKCDYLFQIDVRLDLIIEKVQQLNTVLT
jgi:hypothetical protein